MIELLFWLSATVFAANQGSVAVVTFPEEAAVKSMELRWEDKKIPFAHLENKWETVVGIDLDTKPGDHEGEVEVRYNDGRIDKRPIVFRIDPVKFPTTELTVDDQYVQLSQANQQRAAREAKELDKIYATYTPEILWSKRFHSPIPGQTKGSNFGHRRVFNGQPRAPHAGSDLKATTGTPIHATNRGRVVLAKNLFFTGNTVVLDHGLGIYTVYAHLSKIDVKVGETAEEDQLLGLAGATGRVTGPHLHWSARIQSARVDPFTLLSIQ
jgi:murein DD-endopeptidase MepM/ murein hydrolase activator NlpD